MWRLIPWPVWLVLALTLVGAHELLAYNMRQNVREVAEEQCDARITGARKEADLAKTRQIAALQQQMTEQKVRFLKELDAIDGQNDELVSLVASMKDSGDTCWTPEMVAKMGGAQ